MICPNCKSEITENAAFCVNCGWKIEEISQENVAKTDLNQSESDIQAAVEEVSTPENTIEPTLDSPSEFQQSAAGAPAVTLAKPAENADGGEENSYIPPQQEPAAPAQPANPKKLIKKIMPFAIGGGVLAIAITVVCCLKFGAADISHNFMGDEKYAASLAEKTLASVADNGLINSAVGSVYASSNTSYDRYNDYKESNPDSSITYSDYTQIMSYGKTLSAIRQQLPENGIYVKAGVKTEFTNKFYKMLAEETGTDSGEIKDIFESFSEFNAEGRFSVKEDGIDAAYSISDSGKELDSGTAYYNTTDGILFYSNPAISGSAISAKMPALDLSLEQDKADREKLTKQKKELIKKIVEVYSKHLKNAETEYSNVTESVGEGEFKGKSMKVTFENEELVELLKDITDVILDSDYFESVLESAYGGEIPDNVDIDDLKDEIETSLDNIDDSNAKISLCIEHFINSDNSLAGLRVTASTKNNGSKSTSAITYFNTKSAFYAEVKTDGATYFKCEGKKSSAKSGTVEITFNIPQRYGDTQKLKLSVEYSDLGTKKLFGQDNILGKFNVKVSGSILDSLSSESDSVDVASIIKKTTFSVSANDKKNGIEYVVSLNNESYGNVSYTLEVGENTDSVSDRAGMTEDSAIDINSGSAETVDININALKHMQDICSKSDLLNYAFNQSTRGESFTEQLQKQIDKLEKNKRYVSVYKDYDENTVYNANKIADNIYDHMYNSSIKSKSPTTIKVFYDNSGKMNIVDMAGEDESVLDKIKDLGYTNCYVEIFCFKEFSQHYPIGVSAIMTDNKDHHCSSLPTVYNYMDKLYSWSDELNYIDEYVVGTYPTLKNGISTYEQKLNDAKKKVTEFNKYAENGYSAFTKYLQNTNNALDLNYTKTYIAFKIQSGTWSNYSGISRYNFVNNIDTNTLFDYMESQVPEINSGYLYIYVSDNQVVGASFSEDSYRVNTVDFIVEGTNNWGIADGVYTYNQTAVGTYPVLKSFGGTIPEKLKQTMIGTWSYRSEQLTITEDDLNYITDCSSYSDEYICVTFKKPNSNSTEYYYFDMAGKMRYNYDTYTKM